MLSKRYIVIGGYVRSRNDGDVHYIEAVELVSLYGVNPAECILVDRGEEVRKLAGIEHDPNRWVRLYPREDGKYVLPR
jgi:hypothetical protein